MFQLTGFDGGSFVMQCPSCRAVYSNGLEVCPRCKTPALTSSTEIISEPVTTSQETIAAPASVSASEETEAIATQTTAPVSSTLIEFPGVSRASRPQWRKELSERVREIQERRARDAEADVEDASQKLIKQPAAEIAAPQLGLVPPQDVPAVNPIVAAALKRLERARQSPTMPRPRTSMGGAAAAATARVAEEQYHTELKPTAMQASAPALVTTPASSSQPQPEKVIEAKAAEQAREHSLIIVPAQPAPKVVPPVIEKEPEQLIPEKVDADQPESLDEDLAAAEFDEALYDDRAPVLTRIAGSAIDMLVVAFASSPFAAIIELTNGNWGDLRVVASMGAIVLIVMFLYLTAATALAGRTWGMSLVSLRAVDADTGLPPTTKQAVGRAALYILSLITLGLGILYALFDAEGRTAHDHLSGTAVVRE
jgi:uncharacterized RDD family membrane protein YckC